MYLSDSTGDLDWSLNLLSQLHQALDPEPFAQALQYSRASGETALLVAVCNGNIAAVKTLLAWGAKVDHPKQHRHGKDLATIAKGLGGEVVALLLPQRRTV